LFQVQQDSQKMQISSQKEGGGKYRLKKANVVNTQFSTTYSIHWILPFL